VLYPIPIARLLYHSLDSHGLLACCSVGLRIDWCDPVLSNVDSTPAERLKSVHEVKSTRTALYVKLRSGPP
jgi:hypothetical protein